ncbi:L,D-transpeptidase family protein [Rapidithrix thailandica]|uniref:L,D-transpeptidase family protein n=1 Tax=Rapidithrix thailandica TaxID=413964 RepID=A0AAW9S3H6_9BACT
MKISILLFTLFAGLFFWKATSFKTEQLKYSRVRTAYLEKENRVKSLLKNKGLDSKHLEIFIRAFKSEKCLELWGKNKTDEKFQLITSYDFCTTSGNLGPKRQEGDLQIPEGFYHINQFNPWSKFYLSLGINYPNASDKILGVQQRLGNHIFIHGNCITIGCIPVTDDKIKELYLFAVEAKNNGQHKIPVHIFPARLNEQKLQALRERYSTRQTLTSFWQNLKDGFDHFENTHTLPKVTVAQNGSYMFH